MVHTVYTYEVYAREYVCNFSGFSKRIPRLESPFVGRDCTLPALTSQPYPVRVSNAVLGAGRKAVHFVQGHI